MRSHRSGASHSCSSSLALTPSATSLVRSAVLLLAALTVTTQAVIDQLLTIRTCGKPNIQNIMNNVTAKPGQSAMFKCQVDMSCIVAYIEWYHEMDNGTEKLIKTASSSGDPHVHVIKQVNSADEGLYTCIAGNVLGQATASAYLEVNSSPPLHVGTTAGAVISTLAVATVLMLQTAWPLMLLGGGPAVNRLALVPGAAPTPLPLPLRTIGASTGTPPLLNL